MEPTGPDHRRLTTRRLLAASAAALALVGAGVASPGAVAQEGDPTTTTSSTTIVPNPAEPATTTTTTTAPPAEEPPPPPPGEPAEDSGPAEVPTDQVVVPPAAEPEPVNPALPILEQLAGITLKEVEKGLRDAQQAREIAALQRDTLTGEVAALEARLAKLEADKAQAVARLQRARLLLKRRAVANYIGSPAAPINRVLDATDVNDLSRRVKLVQAVIDADNARIDEYTAAREAVSAELEQVVAELDAKRAGLLVAGTVLDGAESALLAKQIQAAAVRAGGSIAGGFVFPVGGPRSFTDTFGAPRMFGTAYAHLHQGTDIFAAHGTPLLACERGVLIKVGSDTLGGTKLWLVGASGTYYYYAHLSAFAEGVADGKVVKAGDVVGYVGNTGNAATTPAHLHFEVHPQGGPAVNPYPLLKLVDDAQKQYRASQPATTSSSRS